MLATGHQVLSFLIMKEIATGTLLTAKPRTVRVEIAEAKDVESVENLFIERQNGSSVGSRKTLAEALTRH
jgi:mannosyltransferase OCH1-like enzyme